MGVKDRQARERQARLDAIRRSALKLFAERGFARTSMDDVAAEAELGKGTVYYYFPSKIDLLEDVLTTYARRFFAELDRQIKDEDSLLATIEKVLWAYLEFHAKNPEFFRLHHRWVADGAAEAGLDLSRFRQVYRELRDPLDRKLEEKVKREFGERLSPEVFLNLVGGLLLVYGHQLQHGRSLGEVRRIIEQTMELLRAGAERLKAVGEPSPEKDPNDS